MLLELDAIFLFIMQMIHGLSSLLVANKSGRYFFFFYIFRYVHNILFAALASYVAFVGFCYLSNWAPIFLGNFGLLIHTLHS